MADRLRNEGTDEAAAKAEAALDAELDAKIATILGTTTEAVQAEPRPGETEVYEDDDAGGEEEALEAPEAAGDIEAEPEGGSLFEQPEATAEGGTGDAGRPVDGGRDVQSALERATHNLTMKTKVSREVLEKMAPEEVIGWWESYSPQASNIDKAFSELAALKKERSHEAPKTAESAEAVPAAVEDFEVDEALAEELSPEAIEGLKKMLAGRKSGQPDEALNQRLAQLELSNEEARAELLYRDLKQAGDFGDKAPEFSRVLKRSRELLQAPGEWHDLQGRERAIALMKAAAALEGAGTSKADGRREAIARARRSGTATPAPQGIAPRKALTEDQKMDAKLAAIRRGVKDPNELRRLYG